MDSLIHNRRSDLLLWQGYFMFLAGILGVSTMGMMISTRSPWSTLLMVPVLICIIMSRICASRRRMIAHADDAQKMEEIL